MSRLLLVLAGACLLIIPSRIAAAGGLRQEAAAYRRQGLEAQRQGDRDAALTLYQKAVALDPAYATAHNDLGVLYEEAGRLDEAEREYLQALALDSEGMDPHANLAMLYERKGEVEKAVYHWMKRYQFGELDDEWTRRAELRLLALGVLNTRDVRQPEPPPKSEADHQPEPSPVVEADHQPEPPAHSAAEHHEEPGPETDTARQPEASEALELPAGVKAAHQQVLDAAFQAHAQSLEEFHDLTEAHGDWP